MVLNFFRFQTMSKKYVLIPLRTFKEICSNVRKNGDTVTGVVKNLDETKEQKKRCV